MNTSQSQQCDRPNRLSADIMIVGYPPINCIATDISDLGATLRVNSLLGIPERFELRAAGSQSALKCKVVQKASNTLRVTFQART